MKLSEYIQIRSMVLYLALMQSLICVSLAGQARFTFDNLTTTAGLPNNTVYDIIEDDLGFIWVGTKSGLSRFDGFDFNTVSLPSRGNNSNAHPTVLSLRMDSKGTMWIGLKDGGLLAYDRSTNTYRTFPFDDDRTVDWSTISVKSIYEDSRHRLWIGTFGGGAIVLDEQRKVLFHFCTYCNEDKNEKLSNDFVFDFAENDRGNIYIATAGKGLNIYDHKVSSVAQIHNDDGTDLNSFGKTLCLDTSGRLWIGTEGGGLYSYDTGNAIWKTYDSHQGHNGLGSDIVTDVQQGSDGRLWVATDGGGLNLYNEQTDSFLAFQYDPTQSNSLSSDAIYDLHFDKSGNLWIGTFNGGVNILKSIQSPFWTRRHYDMEKRIGLRSVLAIQEDDNDRVWLGTDGGGLFYFDAAAKELELRPASKLLSGGTFTDVITCIQPLAKKGLWFGSFANGLSYYDFSSSTITNYLHDEHTATSIVHNNVWDLELDQDGTLWIATLGGGVDYLTKGDSSFKHLATELSSVQVIDILIDKANQYLWVATESGGLNRVDLRSFEVKMFLASSDSRTISSNNLSSLFEDSRGNIWILSDAGIDLINSEGQISSMQTEYSFFVRDVTSIAEDADGYIWLTSATGIHRVDSNIMEFLDFGIEPALANNTYNSRAARLLNDGRIVFGGVHGFSIVEPSAVQINTNEAAPLLTDFRVSNQSIAVGSHGGRTILTKDINDNTTEIRLSHLDRGITFELGTSEYTDPSRSKYAYKLEGFDQEWKYVDAQNRTIYYSSLAGGSYKLKIKAANSSGVWSSSIRSIDIKVAPPFWKRAWFIVLVFSALILCILSAYRFLLNRQRETYRRQALLQEKEILKKEQQILQLTNTALEEEVYSKRAELSASALQAAHKNEFLNVLKNRIKKLKSNADEQAAKPLRSIINIINTELKQEDYWEKFQLIFDKTFQDFIEQIATKYPTLTSNDHRICCFIKMKLNNREIAAILNITLSAVEQAKYRLKKKLSLQKADSLTDFIQNFGQG